MAGSQEVKGSIEHSNSLFDTDEVVNATSTEESISKTTCECNPDPTIESPCDCDCEVHEELPDSNNGNDEESKVKEQKSKAKIIPKVPLGEKKPKLRTSKDVYDRLKWDSASVLIKKSPASEQNGEGMEQEPLDLNEVYIGYKDRFLGICELPFEEFEPGGEIPYHRVYYFRTGGPPIKPFIGTNGEVKVREDNLPKAAVFIWDRDSRTDLVFHSGNSWYFKDLEYLF